MMTPSLQEHATAREIPGRYHSLSCRSKSDQSLKLESFAASFYDPQSSRGLSPPTVDQLLSQFVRPHSPHLVDCEPEPSPDNPINLEDRMDEEHDTEPLSDDQEASPLGGDTECECDIETDDGRNSEATSIQDLEGESQTQPQSGSRPTGPDRPEPEPEPKVVNASKPTRRMSDCHRGLSAPHYRNGLSKDTHATVGHCFAHHLEADTNGPHILLHLEAGYGRLEFLLWAPIWSQRMTLRRSLQISSSDTRRSWTSGLHAGPLRRESEHGPLCQSPGDHHGKKSRGGAKNRFCRWKSANNPVFSLSCMLVLPVYQANLRICNVRP
ncbi:hypothetical protein ACJ73_04299 [Blastomyces percursus]|uniref:Uncharacterized protein n=1 Tax=Blastomyces percursus TaxID=1658174 RepID=A0A1J9Q6I3_9EURO|nr:hypothetical protein ACJ73_04299 [Blastomyces percursus]